MGDDSEWLKLPTEEKCVHKVWKARVAGYEEATKLFQMAGDEKNPVFSKYLGIVKKFVVDNNAIAQEKGLDAVLAFVENGAVAGKAAGEVCSGIVTKCLNSSRAKTKEKGMEILLMYIEIEKQEIVLEALMTGLTNKQPKIVAACVQTLRQALTEFGSKIVPIKPMVKQIQRLLEDRDKIVRDEGKQLVIEIYRWIGPALKPQLSSLKPVQVSELEAEFENTAPGSARQTRFLRSQQDLKAKMEEQAAAGSTVDGSAGDEAGAPEEVDPYDLMDPVEILSKLPKDYYEKIEAKKWQERKEALEAVQKLVENPKLEPGDYHDLVKTLKKVIAKDANVLLVALAARVLAGLANGLRKKFSTYAPGCIDVILEKFKEKKPNVVAALREAIDASYQSTTLETVQDMCIEALGHKTPSVKSETASFLARCFARCTPATLPKKILKAFVTALLKTINDTTPEVREASYNALGTAMKVVGEKPILPFLLEIDNIKMAKIKEYCEKAELIGKDGQPKGGGSAAAPAPTAAPAATTAAAKKPVAKPAAKPKENNANTTSSAPSVESSSAPSKPGAVRPKTGQSKGAGAKKGGKGKKGGPVEKEEKLEAHLCDEVVDEKAAELLPPDLVTGLTSSNWKERLAAIEKFHETIKVMSKEAIPAQVCVRVLTKKPGLKDNNFQVMKLKVELIRHLAMNSEFSKTTASYCLNDLVDKIGDVKNGAAVQEALSCIAEATSLEYVSEEVLTLAFAQKNPKTHSEALNWLARAIKEFGFKVNVKLLVDTIKKGLAATNPAVRTASIALLGVMYMYMGAPLRVYFESEKAALVQQIDDEINKVKGEKPPTPIRGITPATPTDDSEDVEDLDEGAEGINVADLVPRNDISDKLTEDIVDQMADKNWKMRKEALEKVTGILNEAKFITPNIGPLPEAIKLRLGDSNKILVTSALSICQTLATAMGPNVKQHIRVIGPSIINCLGDSKPTLRQSSVATLNTWIEQTGQAGFAQFIEAEIFSDALKLENPYLRAELLGWLAEKLPNYRKLPNELKLCTPYLFACLEDRSPDVRKKANESVVPFMVHTGYDHMVKQASKLKPSSKDQVMKILEAARANLPKKEPKAKPVSAKPSPPPAAAAAAAEPVPDMTADEIEETPAPSKPANAKAKGKVIPNKKPVAPATTKKKKDAEEDTTPPLRIAGKGKEQRFKDEKALKALKWNFTAPRAEYIDQLRQQMEPTFSKTLIEFLFHADFKNHIKAIDILTKALEDIDATIANLDLILKWVTLRFFDTNTSVLLRALDYLQQVFNILSAQDYHLQDPEASSFVPYLINKIGDPKDNIRKSIHEILKTICKVYPASKMFNYIIDGLKSKNSKQRTECLDELCSLIEVYGINVCQPSPAQALKIIAQQISDRDNSVRLAALNAIVSAYYILGDTVYKYIGNLSDKEAGMLEERIKRSSRTRPQTAPAAVPSQVPNRAQEEKTTKPTSHVNKNHEEAKEYNQTQSGAKVFSLDIDESEESCPEIVYPTLVKIDYDRFLNDPIKIPDRWSRRRVTPSSVSLKLLQNSADAQSALDLVISQVGSNDIMTSLQALAQIDGVLKDEEKSLAMLLHVDQFLLACSLQLRLTYSKHLSEQNVDKNSLMQLYKRIFCLLIALFECKPLARTASQNVIRDLIQNLLLIMLDNRLNEFPENAQVIRSINVIMLKIYEKSNHTAVMSALIQLLHENIATKTASPKFVELLMKSLWKMVRMLPDVYMELQVDKILLDIHRFLQAFPSHTWKLHQDDVPLRTIKTIVHSLAKLKGPKIMEDLERADCRNSEVEAYLRKVLKNENPNDVNASKKHTETNASADVEMHKPNKDAPKSTKRVSRSTHDLLAEIFRKIGSRENTREGLNDLYDFKLKYPEADLEPFLKKSSKYFQDYIERGLKNIEIERENKMRDCPASAPTNAVGIADGKVGNNEAFDLDFYREKLRTLRIRAGLSPTCQVSPDEHHDLLYYEEKLKEFKTKILSEDCPDTAPANVLSATENQPAKTKALDLNSHGSNSSLSSNSSEEGINMKDSNHTVGSMSSETTSSSSDTRPTLTTNTLNLKKRLQAIKARTQSK